MSWLCDYRLTRKVHSRFLSDPVELSQCHRADTSAEWEIEADELTLGPRVGTAIRSMPVTRSEVDVCMQIPAQSGRLKQMSSLWGPEQALASYSSMIVTRSEVDPACRYQRRVGD